MNIPAKLWQVVIGAFGILIIFLAVLSIKEIKSIGYVGKDAPIYNTISVNGKGEAFSPTDLVCAALGSCMVTIKL